MLIFATQEVDQYVEDKVEGYLSNLPFFVIGIGIGVVLFLIALLVVYLISKGKKKETTKPDDIIVHEEYRNIILNHQIEYKNQSFDGFKDKFSYIGKAAVDMMEEIATLYYPESEDPMFEVSIDDLINFLGYFSNRLNYFVDNLLEDKLHFVDVILKYKTKDYKIAIIFELMDKGKKGKEIAEAVQENQEEKPKKPSFFSKVKDKIAAVAKPLVDTGKKMVLNYSNNLIDEEFNTLISDIGDDINKLYSGQELFFTDVSKRETRQIKKKFKKLKKEGDMQ